MAEPDSQDLRRDLTRSAQEIRLLADILAAIAATNNLDEVIQILRVGVVSILPSERWPRIRLMLVSDTPGMLQSIKLDSSGANRYWSNIRSGVMAAERAIGVNVEYSGGSVATQVQLLETAIRSGADAIAIAPFDSQACEPGFAAARQAGIPLVVYDARAIPGTAALAYIGADNQAMGQLAGAAMRRLLPQGGTIATACNSLHIENGRARIAGFTAACTDPAIQILPALEDQYDTALAADQATALLRDHADLAGVFGACGTNGPAIGTALIAAGRAGKVRLVCFDLGADTIRLLTEGVADVVIAQREREIGYRTVELLTGMVLNGSAPTLAQLGPDQIFDIGVDLLTLEPTPWSIGLVDYLLQRGAPRAVDLPVQQALRQRDRPLRIVVIGVEDLDDRDQLPQLVSVSSAPLAAQTIRQGRTQVVVNEPRAASGPQVGASQRLTVAVPLLAGTEALGALVLEGAETTVSSPQERVQLERLAGAVAVAIQNARLLQRLEQRAAELSAANARQQELITVINELSSPVVPIVAGVLVLPLVGAMDSQRATRFLETLLEAISARQAEVVLIDISGVPVVDTGVAFHLTQAARATRLLGAEAVLSGITAPVAQTLIGLGVDLNDLRTFADLQSAFAYALIRVGGRLTFAA